MMKEAPSGGLNACNPISLSAMRSCEVVGSTNLDRRSIRKPTIEKIGEVRFVEDSSVLDRAFA